jgi:hypothetical protein
MASVPKPFTPRRRRGFWAATADSADRHLSKVTNAKVSVFGGPFPGRLARVPARRLIVDRRSGPR